MPGERRDESVRGRGARGLSDDQARIRLAGWQRRRNASAFQHRGFPEDQDRLAVAVLILEELNGASVLEPVSHTRATGHDHAIEQDCRRRLERGVDLDWIARRGL